MIVGDFLGYAAYLETEGGTVSEIDLEMRFDVSHWSALYGTAWGVGWTQEWLFNLTGNVTLTETDNEKHLLFICFEPLIEHELYASMVPEADIDFVNLEAATPAEVNAYMNLSGTEFFSATNTFTTTATFEVGDQTITAPATYTYSYNSENSTYFVTGILKEGTDIVFVTKVLNLPVEGFAGERFNYQLLLPVQNSFSQEYYVWSDPLDECPAGAGMSPFAGFVYGNVTDTSGNPLGTVLIEISNKFNYSNNVTGTYNMSVDEGNWSIFAYKTGYEIYRSNVTVARFNGTEHNIVMVMKVPPNPPLPGIGPGYDQPGDSFNTGVDAAGTETKTGKYDIPPVIQRPKKIEGTDYIVSISEINRKLRLGNFLQEKITLYSFKEKPANVIFSLEGNVSNLIKMDKESMLVPAHGDDSVTLTIFGVGEPGIYNGTLRMDGDINVSIPIVIEILPKERMPVQALLMDLELDKKVAYPGNALRFKTDLMNLLTDMQYPVQLFFTIQDSEGKETIWTADTNVFLRTSFSLLKTAVIPQDAKPGEYVLRVTANYLGLSAGTSTIFRVSTPWYLIALIGPIKVWHLLTFIILALLIILAIWQIKKRLESKKKFHLKVELNELPKPGPRSILVGKIAETDHQTYMNMEAFMTHTIDAGSTGSGKSVSAQVIVEEMLLKGVAVLVFDPTAQWTGMLRKCTDKVMFSLYPMFGMKPSDAKAFSGNIRQINNSREVIDIKKYLKPGEIQIFACHKLEPKEMDIFVANTIREVFRANFPESRSLKVLLVYDEVHRLLPKFGGSGEGFLQIERGCREFRKWGLGVLLISQVLSDFVGTIKANINTEIQMRTRDEGDLERIKTKYGADILQSLVKATVGSGMVENPHYNRGKPYFIAFRPLLHSVQRLSDEEIEKYNEFNEKADQLAFELEQLEKEGIDIFDLKLEFKLATDKIKTGNFNMMQIYLDGILPRIQKHWEKLGKTPEKLEKKLVSESELQEAITRAKKARQDYEAEMKKEGSSKPEEGGKAEASNPAALFRKDVNPDKILKLVNGMLVINMASLYDEIAAMKDDDYAKHVNAGKNDFAAWVKYAVGDAELASRLELITAKQEILDLLGIRKSGKPLPKIDPEKAKQIKDQQAAQAATPAKQANLGFADSEKKAFQKSAPAQKVGEPKRPETSKPAISDALSEIKQKKEMIIESQGMIVELVNQKDLKGSIQEYKKLKTLCEEFPHETAAEKKALLQDAITIYESIKKLKQALENEKKEIDEIAMKEQMKEAAQADLEKKVKPRQVLTGGIEALEGMEGAGAEIVYTFRLESGQEIKNLEELKSTLKSMDDATFRHYVGDDYNRFAEWIKEGLHQGQLAEKVSQIKDKGQMLEALERV
jgi:hypothetical protein